MLNITVIFEKNFGAQEKGTKEKRDLEKRAQEKMGLLFFGKWGKKGSNIKINIKKENHSTNKCLFPCM